MLVLSRKKGERIRIGPDIVITVCSHKPGAVRIGVEAPRDIEIVRDELPPLADPIAAGNGTGSNRIEAA